MKASLWAIVGTAIVLAVGLGVWEFCGDMTKALRLSPNTFRLEMLKVFWQFLLLVVLGGAIALFFKGHKREAEARKTRENEARQRQTNRREVLLSTRDQLVEAYHDAKSIRRLLRGLAINGIAGKELVPKTEYITLMRRLIDAQLRFEFWTESIEPRKEIFGEDGSLVENLRIVEDYLNGIVGEFEKARGVFGKNESALLSELGKLQDFASDFKKNGPINLQFKVPFGKALKAIEAEANKV